MASPFVDPRTGQVRVTIQPNAPKIIPEDEWEPIEIPSLNLGSPPADPVSAQTDEWEPIENASPAVIPPAVGVQPIDDEWEPLEPQTPVLPSAPSVSPQISPEPVLQGQMPGEMDPNILWGDQTSDIVAPGFQPTPPGAIDRVISGVGGEADPTLVAPNLGQVPAAPAPGPAPQELGFVDRYLTNPLVQGKRQLDVAANVAGLLVGGLTPEQFAEAHFRDTAEAAEYPLDPRDTAAMEAWQNADGFFEGAKALWDHKSSLPVVISQSLPASGVSAAGGLAGGVAGGLAGGVAGGAVAGPVGAPIGAAGGAVVGTGLGAGAASGAIEFGNTLVQFLEEKGLGATPQTLAAAINDPTLFAEARDYAMKRGLAIGVFDALSAGVAGKFMPQGVKTTVGQRLVGAGKEVGVQATLGAEGEAAAQIASEGKITNGMDIALEGISELGTGGPEVLAAAKSKSVGSKFGGPATKSVQTETITPGSQNSSPDAGSADAVNPVFGTNTQLLGTTLDTQPETAPKPLAQEDFFETPRDQENPKQLRVSPKYVDPQDASALPNPEPGVTDVAGVAQTEQARDAGVTPEKANPLETQEDVPAIEDTTSEVPEDPGLDVDLDEDLEALPEIRRDETALADTPDENILEEREDVGSFRPKTLDASYTNRRSWHESAFEAMGLTPDEGVNLPPLVKQAKLRQLMTKTFGFARVVGNGKVIDQNNAMMDAYRNSQYMLHALELPDNALGLNNKLSLSLDKVNKRNRYFGLYDGRTRTIHMPGRSNSFAHEWAHALDHELRDALTPQSRRGLLTQAAREGDLDVTDTLQEAYANLINKMFFDEGELALKVMDLENQIATLPPTAAAAAQARLDNLVKGATRLRIKPSEFHQNAEDFDGGPGGYFSSVHEMLARSFEAYVAHKVETAGGSNEFITKGERAYLSDADDRLKMTFPKAEERERIFAAYDEVMHHLRSRAILGSGPAASAPPETTITDPVYLSKWRLAQGADPISSVVMDQIKQTANIASLHSGRILAQTLKNSVVSVPNLIQRSMLMGKAAFSAMNDHIVSNIKLNPKAAQDKLLHVWHKFSTEIGHGDKRTSGKIFEEAANRPVNADAGKIERAIEKFLRAKGATVRALRVKAGGIRMLTKEENSRVRDIMLGRPPSDATAAEQGLAADLRRIMDDNYLKATKSGMKVGYVQNTGYLTRQLDDSKVEDNQAGFRKAATEVNELVFDGLTSKFPKDGPALMAESKGLGVDAQRRAFAQAWRANVAARRELALFPNLGSRQNAVQQTQAAAQQAFDDLRNAARTPWAARQAERYIRARLVGSSTSFDTLGPDTKFDKTRVFPPEADKIMEEFYNTDVLDLVLDYSQKINRRVAYMERAGNPQSETKTFDGLVKDPEVQRSIRLNPTKYNQATPTGRLNIIKDLARPADHHILEITLDAAFTDGASADAIRKVRAGIESIAGQSTKGAYEGAGQRFALWANSIMFLSLLGRSTWGALTEPLATHMKTGNFHVTARTLLTYMSEAVRFAKTTQERAEIASLIGLTNNALYESVLMGQIGEDGRNDANEKLRGVMSNYFRGIGMAQVTNASRRAAMAGGHAFLGHLSRRVQNDTGRSKARAIADMRELGIPEDKIEDFSAWVLQRGGQLPDLADLSTATGQVWADAVARFAETTVQEPKRGDKPAWASDWYGKLVFGLMSFQYAFFRNAVVAPYKAASRDYDISKAAGHGNLSSALWVAPQLYSRALVGVALVYLGQVVTTMVREALFNSEAWEEKKKEGDDEFWNWIKLRAASRTGVLGPMDTLMNSLINLRYETDLTGLPAGRALSLMASAAQDIGKVFFGRNSSKTVNTEHKAITSAYRLISAGISGVIATLPVPNAVKFPLLNYVTSWGTANDVADAIVGEKTKPKKKKKPED